MHSRSNSVLTELRDMILRGDFPAGFHLQEVPLAKRMGVSRTPIREALTILAKEGLLEAGPRRGFKVRIFTLKDVLNAYEVRATLEGLAARLLAEKGLNRAARQTLERCLKIGDDMLAKGSFDEHDQEAWLQMNDDFHGTLVHDTENLMLMDFVEQSYRIPLASSHHVHWYRLDDENFQLARRAHQFHHDVYEAIINGQAVRAEALMSEHIYFSQRQLAKHVTSDLVSFGRVTPEPDDGIKEADDDTDSTAAQPLSPLLESGDKQVAS